MKLQNQRGGQIFLQDIKKPGRDNQESGLNVMQCAMHLEKSVNQSLQELHKLATDKSDTYSCDFIETHNLNEQVKSTKELGDYVTNMSKTGAPRIFNGRVSLQEHIPGHRGNESESLLLTPHNQGATKAVYARWGYLYFFYTLHQNIHLRHSFK
uniref:Ferritin n=1 Tax=Oryctolagus cuniculus TaxID=9986 RepID=G1U717_RABIT